MSWRLDTQTEYGPTGFTKTPKWKKKEKEKKKKPLHSLIWAAEKEWNTPWNVLFTVECQFSPGVARVNKRRRCFSPSPLSLCSGWLKLKFGKKGKKRKKEKKINYLIFWPCKGEWADRTNASFFTLHCFKEFCLQWFHHPSHDQQMFFFCY